MPRHEYGEISQIYDDTHHSGYFCRGHFEPEDFLEAINVFNDWDRDHSRTLSVEEYEPYVTWGWYRVVPYQGGPSGWYQLVYTNVSGRGAFPVTILDLYAKEIAERNK